VSAVERLMRSHRAPDAPLRMLAASGQLGYGIPEPALRRGMARAQHFVGCDMGSIDPGPYYLGAGVMAAPPDMVYRDLDLVLCAALDAGVPLIIGSAGTAGARPQLEATIAVLHRIARARRLPFQLVTVASDIAPDQVIAAIAGGKLVPIGAIELPSAQQVRDCSHIVGQCGTDTLVQALALGADVVLAGRAYDTAIFAALPVMLGYPMGLALHIAKIIECTSLCCQPGGRDAMLAELSMDGFTFESMNPDAHATPASVAAHALHEQADPLRVEEPEGTLLLDQARYAALDAHPTRVHGAHFIARAKPSLKIEGASLVGQRVLLLAGVADPGLLDLLPQALVAVEQRVRALVPGAWAVFAHVNGQGAVRPLAEGTLRGGEAGLVLEFIAPQVALARTAAGVFKQNLLHYGYPGRKSTAGNLAFAFTPSEIDAHAAYRFVLYHVMQDVSVADLFALNAIDVDGQHVH
jgi:hypothetical protein